VAEGGDVVAEGVGDGEPEAVVGDVFELQHSKGHIQRDRQNNGCHPVDGW
jgi:hypothetical protein